MIICYNMSLQKEAIKYIYNIYIMKELTIICKNGIYFQYDSVTFLLFMWEN